jgi:peptide/nickel transport system substrate-binding protein
LEGALIERGDADNSMDLPPRDYKDIADAGKIPVHSVPMYNTMKHLAMLTTAKPFDDVRVRRAVAYAIPYQQIIDSALFGRARALHGAGADAPKDIVWPQAFPYNTDANRAKALLAEAGYASGFETSLAFDAQMATVDEPVALIIQDALSKIGIKATVNKVPDFPARRNQKAWPMAIDLFGAWFDDPDFFFRWIYHGQNTVWNLGGYKNEKMDQLLNAARNERQGPQYTALARQFIRLAMDDVPVIPLYQPVLDVAVQKSVGGYRYMFYRNPDFRTLAKA